MGRLRHAPIPAKIANEPKTTWFHACNLPCSTSAPEMRNMMFGIVWRCLNCLKLLNYWPALPPPRHPPILRTINFFTAATSLKADYSSYSSCGHGRKFYCVLAEQALDFHALYVFHQISVCNASCKMATLMPHGKSCGEFLIEQHQPSSVHHLQVHRYSMQKVV